MTSSNKTRRQSKQHSDDNLKNISNESQIKSNRGIIQSCRNTNDNSKTHLALFP